MCQEKSTSGCSTNHFSRRPAMRLDFVGTDMKIIVWLAGSCKTYIHFLGTFLETFLRAPSPLLPVVVSLRLSSRYASQTISILWVDAQHVEERCYPRMSKQRLFRGSELWQNLPLLCSQKGQNPHLNQSDLNVASGWLFCWWGGAFQSLRGRVGFQIVCCFVTVKQ